MKTISVNSWNWETKLLEALWAYQMTFRSTTGHSPYQIVFGKEPIFPIES